MRRPDNWTVHAVERLIQRYPGHAFRQEEIDGVFGRIIAQWGESLESRVYGTNVTLNVRMRDTQDEPVTVRMVFNVAGKKIMTVLPAGETAAIPVA